MRHHKYNSRFKYEVDPIEFDKYTDKNILRFCLGATMYMPGTKDFLTPILTRKYLGLTSMVMCFEDAVKEDEVENAEENVLNILDCLVSAIEKRQFDYKDLPLIFFRVRSVEQFVGFSQKLKPEHISLICGFNFPKFNSSNSKAYLDQLVTLNSQFAEVLYGMPILEDAQIAHKETRMDELIVVKSILDKYSDLILNIRVGATDFSSIFGMRRGINYTIYDIVTVRDCLQDILNVFLRDNLYTVSGPVWEYFRASKDMRFEALPDFDFQATLIQRKSIINDAVDGLMREMILDKANGFIGKTIIHPTHLNYVNGLLAVTKEEYDDACQILDASGGVIKSSSNNKMNEIGPHRIWAERLIARAQAYGVIKDEASYLELIGNED